MAVGLARQVLEPDIEILSAGTHVSPFTHSANDEAVRTLRQMYGIDISTHRPMPVTSDHLLGADLIIVLDSISQQSLLKDHARIVASRVRCQFLDDPYLAGTPEAYQACAATLREYIEDLARDLGK